MSFMYLFFSYYIQLTKYEYTAYTHKRVYAEKRIYAYTNACIQISMLGPLHVSKPRYIGVYAFIMSPACVITVMMTNHATEHRWILDAKPAGIPRSQ